MLVLCSFGPVAQLDRASVFGTEGWGFDSLRGRHIIASVSPFAQRLSGQSAANPSCELPIIRKKRMSTQDAISELTRSYNKRPCRNLWIFTTQNRGENSQNKDAPNKVVLKIVYGLTVTTTTP